MDGAGVIQGSALDGARREPMRTPDEVAAMLALKARGWGVKRIARKFGTCPKTVRGMCGREPGRDTLVRGVCRRWGSYRAGWRSGWYGMAAMPT